MCKTYKSFFINVPVQEKIRIMIENVYNHLSIPPPAIQPNILEKLHPACTIQIPLYDLSGKIFTQTEGISMDSSLGLFMSEFYISLIENRIFFTLKKPKIYVHYVDDIFIATQFYDKINKLKQTLEKNFVLKFTTELNINKKRQLPFLDVITDSNNNSKFITSLYEK